MIALIPHLGRLRDIGAVLQNLGNLPGGEAQANTGATSLMQFRGVVVKAHIRSVARPRLIAVSEISRTLHGITVAAFAMCNTTLYLPHRRNTMQDRARWLDMVSDAPYETGYTRVECKVTRPRD
ncbi:hypothetical protein PT2222_410008 [Paraburkholderia tropica]